MGPAEPPDSVLFYLSRVVIATPRAGKRSSLGVAISQSRPKDTGKFACSYHLAPLTARQTKRVSCLT
jgi:hypothetical protein